MTSNTEDWKQTFLHGTKYSFPRPFSDATSPPLYDHNHWIASWQYIRTSK